MEGCAPKSTRRFMTDIDAMEHVFGNPTISSPEHSQDSMSHIKLKSDDIDVFCIIKYI
jgi:hypothetical protein